MRATIDDVIMLLTGYRDSPTYVSVPQPHEIKSLLRLGGFVVPRPVSSRIESLWRKEDASDERRKKCDMWFLGHERKSPNEEFKAYYKLVAERSKKKSSKVLTLK